MQADDGGVDAYPVQFGLGTDHTFMKVLGTIESINPSRRGGMSHYNIRCPEIPGNALGASFTAPVGKYKIGDPVYDDELAPMLFAGLWDKDGTALY
jgi:hypothetical protein